MTANLPICRTCLEHITEKEYPLTGQLVFNVDLNVASMLEFCTSNKLVLHEDLPNSVCVSCFKTIRIAYKFLKQVSESEKKLQENLELKTETCQEYVDVDEDERESNADIADADDNADPADADPDNANADGFLSCHDYVEQITNKLTENELEDDNFQQVNDDATSRDAVTDINKIAEQFGNGKIEIETIGEQKPVKVVIRKSKSTPPFLTYDCPMCDRKISHLETFQRHVELHDMPVIKCIKCTEQPAFVVPDYIAHYKVHHRYQCEICDKSLVSKQGYDYHIRVHTTPVRYSCTVKSCRRTYTTMKELKAHIESHNITKVYPCNLCDATFAHKGNLKYHLKQHAGKKDHLCPLCGRTFYQSGALKIHILRHTQTKRFFCEKCGKGFLLNTLLKKHLNICKEKTSKTATKSVLRKKIA